MIKIIEKLKITTYKKYFFARDVKGIPNNDLIILKQADPKIALISHKHKSISSYNHVLSKEELKKYSDRVPMDEKKFLNKVNRFGEFTWSKNKSLLKKFTFIVALLLFEIVFVYSSNDTSPFYKTLEIVGTTLTFFFSFSYLEYEGHHLMLESYDSEAEREIKNVNLMLSGLGMALFLVGFFSSLWGDK